MRITLSPPAREAVKLFSRSGLKSAGLLLGQSFGGHVVIDQILPLPLTRSNCQEVMQAASQQFASGLLGVVFLNRRHFLTESFIASLVLSLHEGQLAVYECDFAGPGAKLQLRSLLEEKE